MATYRRRPLQRPSADILVNDQGTTVGFTPRTPLGTSFLKDDVEAEPWQWMGDTLWADHRMAQGLIDGARDQGISLGGC